MTTATKKPLDLLDLEEQLLLYRDYVTQCIEDRCGPMPFMDFRREINLYTDSATFELVWEGAAGGFLTGTNGPEFYSVRIPHEILTGPNGAILDSEALTRIARKFANKMNRRLPTVLYEGKRIYHWTWD